MMMLPRIEARAKLSTIEAIGLAMGSSDDPVRKERIEALQAQVRGDMTADQPKRRKPSADQLADMGVAMIVIGADGKPIEGAGHG